jgi:hypothetical protein
MRLLDYLLKTVHKNNNWIADTRMESIVYSTRFGDLGVGAGMK